MSRYARKTVFEKRSNLDLVHLFSYEMAYLNMFVTNK